MLEDQLALPEAPPPRTLLLNAELRSILLDLENRHERTEGEIALAAIRTALDHVAEKDPEAWLAINRSLADIAAETVADVERALAADRG